ncbi:sensor histidine kinase [Roseateles sp. L2-2]|uniref:sensor histidine kinase n=1 Tax=Roseateles sp. L2-2 TaxID=3422597 RepID=UPI003D369921
MRTKPFRRIAPWRYTIGALLGAVGIIGLILFALYDSVTSAKVSEQQVRENTQAAELSNFLLATREPDGSSLLENPSDFSESKRELRFVQLRKSFYSYLLNRQNARNIAAEKILFEVPRPCVTELVQGSDGIDQTSNFSVQACFATIQGDQSGRYAYFALRYPSEQIQRHKWGAGLKGKDRIILRFGSARETSIVLVYRAPTLAMSRYPSQIDRFAGIHELTAFAVASPDRPLHQVNAQAFERRGDGDDSRNYVTVVGRIDAGLLDAQAEASQVWPTPSIAATRIGLDVYRRASDGSEEHLNVPIGFKGRSLVSLQNAYLATVPSRSKLVISRKVGAVSTVVWSSANLSLPAAPRRSDLQQRVFDWWAPKLMAMARYRPDPSVYSVPFLLPAPAGELKADLTAPPVTLPGFATRAFGWLTAALLLTLILTGFLAFAVVRLRILTHRAWKMKSGEIDLDEFNDVDKRRDEFTTLWRVLRQFYRRSRSNHNFWIRQMQQAAAEKAQQVRMLKARLELRQERLTAIGHEIRSPLASLMVRSEGDEVQQNYLRRIHNAIEAIFDAATVEDGIQNQKIVCMPVDLADYLARLVENSKERFRGLVYVGPTAGVVCLIDDIYLETVLNHLLNNAVRYRTAGSEISIRLNCPVDASEATVEVYNEGQAIPADNLKSIFLYKTSESFDPQNKGIGLFAAKSYLIGMNATIVAANRDKGVSFIIAVPMYI